MDDTTVFGGSARARRARDRERGVVARDRRPKFEVSVSFVIKLMQRCAGATRWYQSDTQRPARELP